MSDGGAKLLAFPVYRRTALVRRAARELSALNGEVANAYWRSMARDLLRDLLARGREMDAARGEVLCFFDAVQAELRRELERRRSTNVGRSDRRPVGYRDAGERFRRDRSVRSKKQNIE